MSSLKDAYSGRRESFLQKLADALEIHLKECFASHPRIDRICTRVKSVDRFLQKAEKRENGKPKYSDPLDQIYDQIASRVVTFYTSDVPVIAAEVRRYFRPVDSCARE